MPTARYGLAAAEFGGKLFAIGGAIGLSFGVIYLLLPTLTAAIAGEPMMILPIPFSDWTAKSEPILPAVATGMAWDLGHLITGMVLPFFAMLGSFIGLIITFVVNPILYRTDVGVLSSWQPGDDTIATLFKNNVDFYFSFGIGVSIAIAAAGVWAIVRGLGRQRREAARTAAPTPDVPP